MFVLVSFLVVFFQTFSRNSFDGFIKASQDIQTLFFFDDAMQSSQEWKVLRERAHVLNLDLVVLRV